MFKLNLKIAYRNLLKNKFYTAVNIIGLSLGLTAFVFVLLYINHEKSYDTWSPALNNVYQIREHHDFFTPDNKVHWQDKNDSRIAGLVREHLPQAVAVTELEGEFSFGNGFSIKTDHADPIMVKQVRDADSSFFHVFSYHFLQGDAQTALSNPKSIVLKHSLAQRLFGTDKVLGKVVKVIIWRGDKGQSLTVTGVVADPESPQSANFNALMRTGNRDKDPDNIEASNYCEVYAKLNAAADTTVLNKTLQKIYIDYKKALLLKRKVELKDFYTNGKTPGLKAIPLREVHANPPFTTNWIEKLKPVVAISIFLLLISVTNFINLATAQSVQRAKEVGVKKVLGAYKKQLIAQFLMESALQSIVSLFLSIVFIELLIPVFNQQFKLELSFFGNIHFYTILLQMCCLFVAVTLLAGFYPAWMLSGYNPVAVLKGNYENGLKGVALRNALVVFQFVISVTFMITVAAMHLQTAYMSNKDLGFDRSKLINIQTNYEDDFAERLKRIPGVKYVATTTQLLGNAFNVPQEISYKGNKLNLNTVTVTMDALPALGVNVKEGRLFSAGRKQDTINSVVLNEAAASLMGKNMVGQTYDVKNDAKKLSFQVIGVIKDYHNEGFEKAVLPTIYKVTQLGGTSMTNNLLVRLTTDNSAAIIKKIEAEWKMLYPDFPIAYNTMDDAFKHVMEDNERFTNMIALFSIASITLSLLGLFSLSIFITKRRTKEIAVRKVLGASNLQIVNLLNKSFLLLVVTANLVAWPIAYIVIRKWLDGFAYRIDMPFLPFAMASVVSVTIAILTVSLQARKAAISDPVNALKYE